MLKKTVLTFLFLMIMTTFYGWNADFGSSSIPVHEDGAATSVEELCRISPYDGLMRTISEQEGNDWRLMSAIAYHESRFTPDIVSRQGARGLMQIMPAVARQFNIGSEQLFDPETNIRVANLLYNRIASSLRLPKDLPAEDRMSLILASYNGGIGHVNDARRLARAHGENPNSWEVVSRWLELKSHPEYLSAEEVRCGKFSGYRQTRAYVRDVLSRYDRYCSMTQ